MTQWQLLCLGPPELWQDNQPVAFRTRKALALLIYLAVEDRAFSREELTAFLWPDHDEARGRSMLRNTLSYCRQALADVGGRLLQTTPQTICLATDNLLMDTHLLHQAYTAGAQSPANPAELLAQLETAVPHYRGDFLSGFSLRQTPTFDDWARQQRETWYHQFSHILNSLSRLQLESGRSAQAITTLQRWLSHNPLEETAYHRLMQAHLINGNHAAAHQTYATCHHQLAAELGIEPSPETIALYTQLHSPLSPALPPAPSPAPLPARPTLTIPFVGRAEEHTRLVAAYHVIQQGQPQVVIISGEAGIGKTRLTAEFLQWAIAQGAHHLSGQAYESGGQLPYRPVIHILRHCLEQENAPEDLLEDVWMVELSRLLPELRERYPDLPPPLPEDSTTQLRLFEAMTRLLLALAARRPLLLWLDDIQWADAATLDWLHYLLPRLQTAAAAVLVLLNLRLESHALTSEFQTWLSALTRQLPVTRLTLTTLTASDMQQLLDNILTAATPDLGQWLFKVSGGQPFFVAETLKLLAMQQVLTHQPTTGWIIDQARWQQAQTAVLPPSVRDMVQSRLAHLPETAGALLTAVAILGQNATFTRLCQIAGQTEDQALNLLDQCLADHILIESHQTSVRSGREPIYLFSHDQICQVVLDLAGEARQRVYHRRAFTLLAPDQAPFVELAHHALYGGLTAEAIHANLAAGDEALRLFAFKDAISHYRQAQGLERETAVLTPQQAQHLCRQLGRAYELVGDWELAEEIYRDLLRLARQANDAQVECEALNSLAAVFTNGQIDLERARTLLQAALAVALLYEDHLGLIRTKWNLSLIARLEKQSQQALRFAEEALATARTLNQPALIARSLNGLIYPHIRLRHWPEAIATGEEAHLYYTAVDDPIMVSDCLRQIGWCKLFLGDGETAVTLLRQAYAISTRLGHLWGEVDCAFKLAQALLETGHYGEAYQLARVGLAGAESMNHPLLLLLNSATAGMVYRTLRALPQARQILQKNIELQQETSAALFTDWPLGELCAVEALAGNWAAAHDYARQLISSPEPGADRPLNLTAPFQIEALLRGGDEALARAGIAQLGQAAVASPRYQYLYKRGSAVLAEWEGASQRAIVHLQESLRLAKQLNLPGEQLQILVALSRLYDDDAQAQTAIKMASEIVHDLAQQMEAEELRADFLSGYSLL